MLLDNFVTFSRSGSKLPAMSTESSTIFTTDRRNFLKLAGAATIAISVPACGPSKEKAVRVTGFVIELCKEALPLLTLLGAQQIAELLETKGIPALEKLKEALSKVDVPTATSTLGTVRNVLSGVITALLKLPESPRRTTIVGILASINTLLLTVEAFIDSEMSTPVKAAAGLSDAGRAAMTSKINKALEATQP